MSRFLQKSNLKIVTVSKFDCNRSNTLQEIKNFYIFFILIVSLLWKCQINDLKIDACFKSLELSN
jgi:hypothetical protein